MKNCGGTGLRQGSFKAKFMFEDVAPDFIVQIKRMLKVLFNEKRSV